MRRSKLGSIIVLSFLISTSHAFSEASDPRPLPEPGSKPVQSLFQFGGSTKTPAKTVAHQDETSSPVASSSRRSVRGKALSIGDPDRAARYREMIARHASEQGVPYSLADAVVRVESRYNPSARNGPNHGLTQINYRTAQSLGYSGSLSSLYDPDTNLRYGMKYLAQAYRLANGDTCGTILRYQAGHRATRMTGAARAYCSKVRTIIASR